MAATSNVKQPTIITVKMISDTDGHTFELELTVTDDAKLAAGCSKVLAHFDEQPSPPFVDCRGKPESELRAALSLLASECFAQILHSGSNTYEKDSKWLTERFAKPQMYGISGFLSFEDMGLSVSRVN